MCLVVLLRRRLRRTSAGFRLACFQCFVVCTGRLFGFWSSASWPLVGGVWLAVLQHALH
jgi:hypothetical protein